MQPPKIVVTLVHIQGPMKGTIQEFCKPLIAMGRNPSNDVIFPVEEKTVSRLHAEIVREGNRFRLVDKSTNGTSVNGQRISDIILKEGDVIEFTEQGPKLSFLYEIIEEQDLEPAQQSAPAAQPAGPIPDKPESKRETSPPKTTAAGLVIQHGPFVRSYKELPITIGRNPKCDFVFDGPDILDEHANIQFFQGRYWVQDLSGRGLLSVNGRASSSKTVLYVDDLISMGPTGPIFRFVAEGCLAEADEVSGIDHVETVEERNNESDDREKSSTGFFSRVKKKIF